MPGHASAAGQAPPREALLAAGSALREILLRQLDMMERKLPGARAGRDPEALHDFRVAVRRTRSALRQVRGVLPPRVVERYSGEFRRLQELSGPARDLDVYVLGLPSLRSLLPGPARPALRPLARLLARRREAAHAQLRRDLSAERIAPLLVSWREYLLRPAPRRSRVAPDAALPVPVVASKRLRKLFRRALREGAAITNASAPAELHELRKTCKKLRYLLEFFQDLLDREEAARAVTALKGLQDALGRYQDLQVQADALLGMAREIAGRRRAGPAAYLAMGMLVGLLREEQAEARREFAERFEPFARAVSRKRLRRLLPPGDPPAGTAGALASRTTRAPATRRRVGR